MSFRRYVEIGRIAFINYGDDQGKICTIVDVVDTKRVYIDGPSTITGVKRQIIPLKRLTLTDLKISKLPHSARLKTLEKLFKEQDILGKWEKTNWALKLKVQQKKASLNDFQRFSLMLAKKKTSRIVLKEMNALKKKSK